jgi:hypothetical protein
MADIDGTVTVTHRYTSSASRKCSEKVVTWQSRSHVQLEQQLDAAHMLYFRAADTGVKWITHIGSKDLL